jgi:hypothetical protein
MTPYETRVHSMRVMCHVSHVQERSAYETRVHSMRVMCHVSHVHRVCMQACSVDALRETSPVINTNHNNDWHALQQQLHVRDRCAHN